MLQLYDINKNKIEGLIEYKDLNIESTLSTGDKVLSFLYPTKFCKNIVEEGYIQTKTDEFVIKEKNNSGIWTTIKAVLNVEDLEGNVFETFDSTEQTIENCLNLALAGTGWTVQVNGVTKKRTVRKTNSSTWDIIQQARKTYRVEIQFDTINKVVKVYEKIGSDKGAYFTEELNLKSLDIQSNSYDFFTRMIAKGKDDLKVIVENYQYSNKVKTCIWKDERYTDINSLREDAILKLDELSKPYRAYKADVIDLARISEKYKNILDYSLGDTITLISKDNEIKEKQRIVKIVEYPDEPERNSCEIANITLSFEDIQKEFQDTSDTVSNITADDGTISETALRVPVERLTINKVDVQELNAVTARVGTLEATKANITELNAVNANLTNLIAGKADITDLTATNIKFNVGSGGTLDLQTLLSKFVTGENGQFLNITSSNTTIANAVIKDAMIENLSLNKLKAGTINTNNINLSSADGGLSIVGPTMQFKDKNNKVRLQLGQDTEGDFNFILRAADGTTTLIDGYGIKEKAIADKLIKSNMVADGAIGEQQINYSSLVTGLNKDTNTSLIKASKVALDLTGQSLEVSFNSLKSVAEDTKSKTESNTTSINAINGQIATLIIDTTIEEDGATVKLKDSYSNLKQTVSGINATIASHSTSISNLTNNLNAVSGKVTTVENKQATLEQNLEGFKTTVSNTYSTKTELNNLSGTVSSINSRVSTAESSINQLNNKIALKVEQTDITEAINALEIGGRNLLLNSYEIVTPNYATDGDNFSYYDDKTCDLIAGETYIVKGICPSGLNWSDRHAVIGSTNAVLWLRGKNGSHQIISSNTTGTTGTTFTVSVSQRYTLRTNVYKAGQYTFSKIKIEKGNVATDWTPAPEDVSNLTTRVNSVEQSITATALTTTISSALAGSNSISTTKFVMDKNGLTIKNGGIKIQNNAGELVMSSDVNGNLIIQSSVTTGGLNNKFGTLKLLDEQSRTVFYGSKEGIMATHISFFEDYVLNEHGVINDGSVHTSIGWDGFYQNFHQGIWQQSIIQIKDGTFRSWDSSTPDYKLEIARGAVISDLIINGTIFNGSYSKSTNGYTKLPNGFILQWGIVTNHIDGYINFPISFPTSASILNANIINSPDDWGGNLYLQRVDSARFRAVVINKPAKDYVIEWIAIGY